MKVGGPKEDKAGLENNKQAEASDIASLCALIF